MKLKTALLTPVFALLMGAAAYADTPITLWGDGTITVNYSKLGAVANLNAGNAGAVGGNTSGTAASRRTFFQISSYNVA